jgi:hypothetical protein
VCTHAHKPKLALDLSLTKTVCITAIGMQKHDCMNLMNGDLIYKTKLIVH